VAAEEEEEDVGDAVGELETGDGPVLMQNGAPDQSGHEEAAEDERGAGEEAEDEKKADTEFGVSKEVGEGAEESNGKNGLRHELDEEVGEVPYPGEESDEAVTEEVDAKGEAKDGVGKGAVLFFGGSKSG